MPEYKWDDENLSYWQKRIREFQLRQEQSDVNVNMALEKLYKRYSQSIQEQIDGFYGRYAKREGISKTDAMKRASEIDIRQYEDKAERYVREKDFTEKANEEMKLYNLKMKVSRLELLKANINLELLALGSEEERQLYKRKWETYLEETKRQAGILGESLPTAEDIQFQFSKVVYKSYYKADFSESIWERIDDLRRYLDNHLIQLVNQGKSPRVLGAALEKKFNVSQFNALRLAVTEMGFVQAESQKHRYTHNGVEMFDLAIEKGACPDCQAIHKRGPYPVSELEPGTNAPMVHPFCRCSTVPVVDRTRLDEMFKLYEEGRYEDVLNL